MPANSSSGFASGSAGDQAAVLEFFFRRAMANVATATLVRIEAVYNTGGVEPVGVVDVQPLINQIDGQGTITVRPMVYGVPYTRLQGGANAVILDPQVGDIGIAVFGDRDLSGVVSTKAQAAPGSNRRNSLADALYVGGVLNGTPTQYVQFSLAGINVVSPTAIKLKAPAITLDGPVTSTSTVHIEGAQTNDTTITATGEVEGKGVKLSTHLTSGVTSGGSNSGPPVPG